MTKMQRFTGYTAALLLAASIPFASAKESEIRIIVLTDNAGKSSLATDDISIKKDQRRNVIRQQILEDIGKQRMEMEKNGFVVSKDAVDASKGKLAKELMAYQSTAGTSFEAVSHDFAYAARNLDDSPFNEGTLLGFMPVRSGDNKFHEAFWAYKMPGIGRVTVEELSYRTIPDVTIKVAEPSGNVQINGNPGTYMVMTDAKGKRGVTTIDFMTADKLFTITAFKPVKRDSKRFRKLLHLAESLY